MKKYLKYSGIWIGLVVNPYHWSFGFKRYDEECLHLGPIWIRVVISNGENY